MVESHRYWVNYSLLNEVERIFFGMAKCAICGKTTTFGHNRSFSLRATNRSFSPNLQKVTIMQKGRKVRRMICASCLRTMTKSL